MRRCDNFMEGGKIIGIDIKFFDLEHLAGLFWEEQNGKWKGLVKDSISNGDYRIIRNEKIIMILPAESLAQASDPCEALLDRQPVSPEA